MCSPTGEHAAVERPGRGAPLAESRRAVPPARSSSSAPTKGHPDAWRGRSVPLFPFLLRFGSCSYFPNWLGFGSSPSDLGFGIRPSPFPPSVIWISLLLSESYSWGLGFRSRVRVRNPTFPFSDLLLDLLFFSEFIRMGLFPFFIRVRVRVRFNPIRFDSRSSC